MAYKTPIRVAALTVALATAGLISCSNGTDSADPIDNDETPTFPFQSDELEIGIACGDDIDPSSITFTDGEIDFGDADIAISTRKGELALDINPVDGNVTVTRGEVENSGGQTITSSASTIVFEDRNGSTYTLNTQGFGISADATLDDGENAGQIAAYQLHEETSSSNLVSTRGSNMSASSGYVGRKINLTTRGHETANIPGQLGITQVQGEAGSCIAATYRGL